MNTLAPTERIQKITSKGQITVPMLWRKRMNTNTIIMRDKGHTLEIESVQVERKKHETWTTIFSAQRDNNGKGIPAEKFLRILKKIRKEEGKGKHERIRKGNTKS